MTALRSLTSIEVDKPGVTSFVCSMYGFTTSDINEARYKAFIRMRGGDEKYPLATIKKSNCASLPPCNKTLGNHVKRAQVVSMNLEDQTDPTGEARPTEYGWKENNNRLEPDSFQEGMSQKLSEPLVETMPQPAWMTPHLTSVMFRFTRTMNEPNG